jgi:hypothetical protein
MKSTGPNAGVALVPCYSHQMLSVPIRPVVGIRTPEVTEINIQSDYKWREY